MLKGIDISHHQKGIDLGTIDVDFVICKATEGNGYTDEMCDTFYQKAKSLGKKLGVYHFARPDLGNSPEAEADWFVKETLGYHKEAMLILDWESGNLKDTVWARKWLDRVYSKTGVKPVIYMSASVMSSANWGDVVAGDYGLWVANYGSNNGTPQESVFNKYPLKYWDFYALWQYTSKGKLNGYNGNLDLNYFSGDGNPWDKYAGGTSSTNNSNTSTTTEKSVDELAQEVIAGKYGNGEDRKNALGSRYNEVQARVNELLGVNSSVYYTVKKGDSLWAIAEKYYGNGSQYPTIKKLNNLTSDTIYEGQKLRIK